LDRSGKSHEANRQAFSARAKRGDAAAREVEDEALETLLEWSAPRGTDRILDLATGAGYLARRFAPRVAWSLGVDLVVEMLDAARAAAREEGITNVGFVSAIVERLPFGDASFDLVLTRRGPHHFADLPLALDEIRRVLKPGGRLTIEDMTVSEDPLQAEWVNAFERIASPSHGRALSPSEWREQLEKRGFVVEHLETRERLKDLGPLLARVSAEERDRLLAHLSTPQAREAGATCSDQGETTLFCRSILLTSRR